MEKHERELIRKSMEMYRTNESRLSEMNSNLEQKKLLYNDLQDILSLFQATAELIHRDINSKIADTVTYALNYIFEDNYIFRIDFNKGARMEANIILEKNGVVLEDIIENTGGGVIDVISFALRTACLIVSDRRRVLIMDEPFKFLSSQYRDKARDLIDDLSNKLDMQFIIVSHLEEFKKGNVVSI